MKVRLIHTFILKPQEIVLERLCAATARQLRSQGHNLRNFGNPTVRPTPETRIIQEDVANDIMLTE